MILVYVDIFGSTKEIPRYTAYLEKLNIKAKVTDDPNEYFESSYKYTHVFLDYGGMDMPGNSMFVCHCRETDRVILEHPSVIFVMISAMGKQWLQNDMENLNEPNVRVMECFLDKNELLKILKEVEG